MSNDKVVWEYCAMRINKDWSFRKLKMLDKDGNHQLKEITDQHQELANLGEQGWELVTFVQISNPDANVYYLKRRKI